MDKYIQNFGVCMFLLHLFQLIINSSMLSSRMFKLSWIHWYNRLVEVMTFPFLPTFCQGFSFAVSVPVIFLSLLINCSSFLSKLKCSLTLFWYPVNSSFKLLILLVIFEVVAWYLLTVDSHLDCTLEIDSKDRVFCSKFI